MLTMTMSVFGSDRSPRSHNLRPFQNCLEKSIFFILAQIFKQAVSNKSAVSEQSESTQRALREHSESTQKAIKELAESSQRALREHSESTKIIKIRVNTVGAYKY